MPASPPPHHPPPRRFPFAPKILFPDWSPTFAFPFKFKLFNSSPPPSHHLLVYRSTHRVVGFYSRVVRIGTSLPPTRPPCRRRVCPPRFDSGGHTRCLEGGGVPVRTRGQALWYSKYNVLCGSTPLCPPPPSPHT
jgi:hypothetical protein